MNYNLSAVNNRLQKLNLKQLTKFFVGFALVIGVITAYFWYSQLFMTPERRFWSAINNSMATPSVVRTLTEGGSGNEVVQDYRFNYAPQRVIENRVSFTERSATQNTEIKTQGFITNSDQFLRYTDYSSQNDTNIDEVLGQWASETVAPEQLESARLNFVSEHVTLAIFGNYSASYRNNAVAKLKDNNIYKVDYNNALEQVIDGKDVYVYSVSVDLKAYAGMLQQAFIDAGLGDFPPLSPDQYQEGVEVNAQFVVNKKDNSIIKISFGGRDEAYGNYGVEVQAEAPEATLTISELQQKVQENLQ